MRAYGRTSYARRVRNIYMYDIAVWCAFARGHDARAHAGLSYSIVQRVRSDSGWTSARVRKTGADKKKCVVYVRVGLRVGGWLYSSALGNALVFRKSHRRARLCRDVCACSARNAGADARVVSSERFRVFFKIPAVHLRITRPCFRVHEKSNNIRKLMWGWVDVWVCEHARFYARNRNVLTAV